MLTPPTPPSATLQTLTLARDYAAAVKKPFPKVDDNILEEKDWPRDCYVFEGQDKEPTIVFMPLFNRNNTKGLFKFTKNLLLIEREKYNDK